MCILSLLFFIKDILPQNKKFRKCFYCYVHKLTYQSTTLFGRLKQFFICFYHSMHHSVILWNSPSILSVNKWNTAYFNHPCKVLTSLLKKQKKWCTGSGIQPYWPTWFGLVASMFYSVISLFTSVCVCINHNNLNFLLNTWFLGHNISDFKYWYQCHQ